MRTPLLTTMLLIGCGGDSTTTDDTGEVQTTETVDDTATPTDTETELVDQDQDGVLSDRDCDDEDPNNFPGNVETCDGQDNDCDSVIDDDPYDQATFYLDADKDGFGTDGTTQDACEAPDGYTDNDEDCDDLNAATYPGAPEDCDGEDQDCDDYIDEDVSGEEVTWYADSDQDGYGSPYYTENACTQPAGHVDNSEDCNDLDDSSFPNAEEVCDDEDNDCDGQADEGSPTGSSTWYIDYDGDGYGSTSFTLDACDAPSGYVDDTSDCNDSNQDVHPGATEICNEDDDDCDSAVDEDASLDLETYYADNDGDGYGDAADTTEACSQPDGHVTNDDDCDDSASDTYPGAEESCDEVDQDCDDDIDEDASDGDTWWIDLDGDGYGNLILTTSDCEQPVGYVDNDDDCDDLEADAWPGNTEVCDGIDNDCDDDADEDSASDAPTWYADSDGDGYGDPDVTEVQCEEPSGHSSNANDCDDGDATINPSALEQCDSADNDCDGDIDEDSAIDVVTWYADADGDGYGDASVSEEHCEAPTGFVDDDNDCDDSEALANPGEAEICNDGIDNNCDTTASGCRIEGGSIAVTKADADWYGESSTNYLGARVRFAGDLDADGFGDMLIGASHNSDITTYAGSAYVIYGNTTIEGSGGISSYTQLYGSSSYEYAAEFLDGGFDVNADGYDDVIVSSWQYDNCGYGSEAGAAWLWYGPITSTTYLYNGDAEYCGENGGDYFGKFTTFPGDVNGDGYDDLLFGAYSNDDSSGNAGAVYLFLGPPSSYNNYASSPHMQLQGEAADDAAGYGVGYAGDVNEDGYDDILVGSPWEDEGGQSAGATYLYYGTSSFPSTENLSAAAMKFVGEYDYDYSGRALASGDLNADDQRDLVISSPENDDGGGNSGIVYVISGDQSGTVDLGSAEATVVGERSDTYAGSSVAVSDIDNDGFDDLVIGAWGVSSYAGAAYIVYGPITGIVDLASADAEIRGESNYDYLGESVDAGGDVNGDGVGDILLGAKYADDNSSESGSAYLFYGTGL